MPAFRSILVPLDGSSFALQALPLAEQFARKASAVVHLVLVHHRSPVWFAPPEVPVDMAPYDAAARHGESVYLEGVARKFASTTGLRVKHQVVDGDVPSAIGAFVAGQSVDLVVMTTHGHSGLARLWLGSTADKLIRHLNIPVLVVRPLPDGVAVPPRIRRILVPLDGSLLSASILHRARTVAQMNGAELVLAIVAEPVPAMAFPGLYPLWVPPFPDEIRMVEDQRYIEAVRNRLEAEGLQVQSRLVVGRKVAREIAELAVAEHCDLIMMATHGAGGLDRLLLGSVTDQLVRRATIPVLVLRPADEVHPPPSQIAAELAGATPA